MRIILGLGNPGPCYARSRHNIGFLLVERLASQIHARFRAPGPLAGHVEVARATAFGDDLILARPLTFMNLAGQAAEALSRRHGVGPEEFIVAYDDVALPLGRMRLRARGSSGGHKGMQSVIDHLGSKEIPRLRMGILGAGSRGDLADYVLREFDPEEWPVVERMLERGMKALGLAVSRGISVAAGRFNRLSEPLEGSGSTE